LTSFWSKHRGFKRRARRSYEYSHTRKRTHTHSLTHKNTQSHTFSLSLMHAHQNIPSQFSLSLSCLHKRWRSRWRRPSLCSFQKSIYSDTRGVLKSSERRRRLAAWTHHHISTHQPQRLVPSQEQKARQTEITND